MERPQHHSFLGSVTAVADENRVESLAGRRTREWWQESWAPNIEPPAVGRPRTHAE